MRKSTTKNLYKKPLAIAASLALCFCLTGVTTLAATGRLEGFFKDITRWDGAVIGTSYEQATDEVGLSVIHVSDELTVEIVMVNPNVAPYSTFEQFGVQNYKIVDMTDNVIVEGATTEMVEVIDGKAVVHISLDNISKGEYKLLISEWVGSSKADQPLVLSGTWECAFTK